MIHLITPGIVVGSGENRSHARVGPIDWPNIGSTSYTDRTVVHNLGTTSVDILVTVVTPPTAQRPADFYRNQTQSATNYYGWSLTGPLQPNQFTMRLRRWNGAAYNFYVDVYGHDPYVFEEDR